MGIRQPRLGSIFVRLAFLVAAVIFLTATVLSRSEFVFVQRSLTSQIHTRLNLLAHERERRLDSFVQQQKERVALVASRTRLRKYLIDFKKTTNLVPDDEFSTGTTRILLDARNSTQDFLEIWIVDDQGTVLSGTMPMAF